MGKVILSVVMMLIGMSVSAADYHYLTFQTASGTTTSVALSNLKITFSNGKLVAVNDASSTSLTLTDLSKMYFSESSSTGIQSTATADNSPVQVFTVEGVCMGEFLSIQEAVQQLKKNVYVIKSKDKTFKLAVK